MPKHYSFRARLTKVWILRSVDVPEKVSRALGGLKERIPVRGWVEDIDIQSTLAPRGGGHRLIVPSGVWRPLKLDAGDIVRVVLFRDEAPEQFPVPPDLRAALAEDDEARATYQRQTPALRRQIANFIAKARRPETREKRIERLLERLRSGKLQA